MPDYGFIANQPQNGGLTSIRDLMGIAGSAQALQSGNLSLQKQRETLLPEIQRIQAESRVSQETADPRISTAQSVADTAKTEAKQRSFSLQREQASAALNEASGLFKDPRITSNDPAGTIDALVEARKRMIAKGIPEHVAEGLTSELISKARVPGAVLNQLHGIMQANAGPGTQAGVINAPLTPVSDQQRTTFQQLQPGAPGAAQPGQFIQNQLPPTTPVFNPQSNTPGYLGPQPPGGPAAPVQREPSLDTASDQPLVTALRAKANQQASQVPTQRFNNRQILDLLKDPKTALAITGPGAEKWAQISGAVGSPVSSDRATDFGKMGHYLALQTSALATAMGAGTDQARDLQSMVAGSPKMTPDALRDVTKVNDAFAVGLERFNQGMERAIQSSGGKLSAARDFQNQWSRSFDPDVYRYSNAIGSGDADETGKILGQVKRNGKWVDTPQSMARARELAQKYQTLNGLVGQ